jgi:hypothetical protein
MTVARIIAFFLALVGFVCAAVLTVREAALAGGGQVTWATPEWYTDTIDRGGWERAGVYGLVALLAAAVLVLVAFRVAWPRRSTPASSVDLGGPGAGVCVSSGVLDKLVVRAAQEAVSGTEVTRARVTRRDERLIARARVTSTPLDVVELQRRLFAAVERELNGATGLTLERLDLDVRRLSHGGEVE